MISGRTRFPFKVHDNSHFFSDSGSDIKSGTWEVKGDTLALVTYTRFGVPSYINMSYSFPNDGTLVLRGGGYGTNDHIFKKS